MSDNFITLYIQVCAYVPTKCLGGAKSLRNKQQPWWEHQRSGQLEYSKFVNQMTFISPFRTKLSFINEAFAQLAKLFYDVRNQRCSSPTTHIYLIVGSRSRLPSRTTIVSPHRAWQRHSSASFHAPLVLSSYPRPSSRHYRWFPFSSHALPSTCTRA